jgi:hypothetical protein
VPNIQAATAIAGWVSANQELPYMTPPIPAPEMNPPQQEQVNFSGDSQDSSELLADYWIPWSLVALRKSYNRTLFCAISIQCTPSKPIFLGPVILLPSLYFLDLQVISPPNLSLCSFLPQLHYIFILFIQLP